MPVFMRFEDIEAWQEGRQLVQVIYKITRLPRFSEDRALKSQLRRAACSVTANIAEGFERGSNAEFIYFLSISKGSAGEIRSLVYTVLDEAYIDDEVFREIYNQTTSIIKKISALIKYLRSSNRKGPRYK
ncbi:MAG: four helix bundle protein [Bacteroidota bacterium]